MGLLGTIYTAGVGHRPIYYIYTGSQTTPDPGSGIIDRDAFQYTLTDEFGFESIAVWVTIAITSAIVSTTDSVGSSLSYAIESPTVNVLYLYGTDYTSPARPLHAQITR